LHKISKNIQSRTGTRGTTGTKFQGDEFENEIFNICGGFEQSNLETIKKLLILNNIKLENIDKYIDWSCIRPGQDVRYALDDSKLRTLGWEPKKLFNEEINGIVSYYKNKFIW
jgi:dTDP-D-glucose 4,6-dehydratase